MRPTDVNTEFQFPAGLELLKQFDAFVDTYKTVDGHAIEVRVLVPKDHIPRRRPVLVRFHGGGFHEGAGDYCLRPWILGLALKHGAVLVAPDYQLMPEAHLQDMDDDLRDFWNWVANDLDAKLAAQQEQLGGGGVVVDTSRLAIVGESAGGYLTAQSVLRGYAPHASLIMLQYPALSIREHLAYVDRPSAPFRPATSTVDDYLASVAASSPGKQPPPVTRAAHDTRMGLAVASMQGGRILADIDASPLLDPMRGLDDLKEEKGKGGVPPVFIFHGVDDVIVLADESRAFVDKLQKVRPGVPVHAVYPPGGHCLDDLHSLDEPWLKEPVEFAERYWPEKSS